MSGDGYDDVALIPMNISGAQERSAAVAACGLALCLGYGPGEAREVLRALGLARDPEAAREPGLGYKVGRKKAAG